MTNSMKAAVSQLASSKWSRVSFLGLIAIYLLKKIRERAARKKIEYFYRSQIEVAQQEREESIKWAREEASLVSDDERKRIGAMDFRQLREALQSGVVSAESVVRVYYGLALAAHDKTNCLTKIIKEALIDARALDEKARNPLYKKPRLFGIPLSVKDSVELEGHRNTWGLAKLVDVIPSEDSYQVMKLRMDGMIPFCQTNLPTGCMAFTCVNSVFGTTTNPHSPSRTCGGSSGGEGALIAAGGSLIGMGSDMGGSIRIPAAFSGCCGFKPSATRCSTFQLPEPYPMRPILMTTEGPLAQDPHAIAEIMRSTWSDRFLATEDAFSVPVDFREDLFKEGTRYRIGYYATDGFIDPLPGNQRVVREAVEILRQTGHDLVPFSLDDIPAEMARGVFATVFANGGAPMAERLKDEPLSSGMTMFRMFLSMPLWSKKLLGWMVKMYGDANTADFLLSQSDKAVDVQEGIDKVYACRKRLVKKMKDEKIDLLLCPATLGPAMPHSLPTQLPFPVMFSTMMWNAMDFPAGVVTASKWSEADEVALAAYPVKGLVESGIKKGCKNSVGLPLSVQIVAPAFRDEMVLRVMVDLHEALKK